MEADQVVFECKVGEKMKRVLVSFRYAINTVDRE